MQQALAGLCAGPAAAAQTNERAAWRQAPSHHVQQVASSRRPSRCNAAATAARPPPLPAADAAAALQPELLLSLQPPAAATAAAAAQQPEQLLCPKLLALQRSCAASSLSADKASREQQERLVNQGAAIRALQRDLPAILDSEPSDLSIYCEGVLFEDRLSPRMGLPAASCQGRDAYARLLWSLRFHRMLFFRQAKVELHRMWERQPGVVCVRWSARAAPRLGDLVAASAGAHLTLDAVSEFHFSDSGHVMKHTVDCTSYSGMQLAPALARLQRSQPALVPGMAGGSFDEC